MKDNRKLKAAVVGLGIGRNHVQQYASHPRVEMTAVADTDEARMRELADEHGIKGRYTDYREMLEKEELDILSVALPNFLHKEVTLAGFAAGCHVLCEKPMAMNATEAADMIRASEAAGKRLMIQFNQRFNEQNQVLKHQIDSGLFGDIYYARSVWHRRRGMPRFGGWFGQKEQSGGGPLIDLGVHKLDLALWLMGHPRPLYVMGTTYDHIASRIAEKAGKKFDVEDFASAMIKLDNGATIMLEASWASHIERDYHELRILGTEAGFASAPGLEERIYAEVNDCEMQMEVTKSYLQGNGSSMHHLVDSIFNDTPNISTGDEGMIVMQILDAIYASAESGRPVYFAAGEGVEPAVM